MDISNKKYILPVNIESLFDVDIENSIALGNWCIPINKKEQYTNIPVWKFAWEDRKKVRTSLLFHFGNI